MGKVSPPAGEGIPETAVVLVGGFGTRLRPLTYEVPKQLIPIAGQVALYHVFDLVPRSVRRIVLACGYKAESIEAYLSAHPYPIPVSVVPEATPLGTGGAMRNAMTEVTNPFFLLNGDVIAGINLEALAAAYRARQGWGTMSLFEVEDTRPYGVAQLDPDGRIVRFVEKPAPAEAPSHWINAGVSVWTREILERIPPGREVSFEREVLPPVLEAPSPSGRRGVYGFPFRTWWEDAGTPERLLNAQRLLFGHPGLRQGPLAAPAEARARPPVSVGQGGRIEGDQLGPYVTLGDDVHLRAGSRVEDSVLMDRVVVGEGASISSSILGPGTVVPPRTVVRGSVLVREGAPRSL